MLFHDIFRNKQAETGASFPLSSRFIDRCKTYRKYTAALPGECSLTVIDHLNYHVPRFQIAMNIYILAIFSITNGIRKEILKYARQ